MNPSCVLALALLLLLVGEGANAQTLQQDRRIEEEKREELKPTVPPPGVPAAPARPVGAPPVPQPIAPLYFAMLAQQRVVFRYDMAKAITVLMGVDEEYIDLNSQVAYLQTKGFLPKQNAQTFDPMLPLRKGEAAYVFLQALGLRGGAALHVLGPTERYALKELAFRGFMAPGHVRDLISGDEFVQLMTQAAQHQAKREAKRR